MFVDNDLEKDKNCPLGEASKNKDDSSSEFASSYNINDLHSRRKKQRKQIDFKSIFGFLNRNTEEYNSRVYVESKMDRVRLHAASVFFAGMYDEKRITLRYIITTVVAIIYAIITFFLVDITGIYSSGTSGLFQGIARLVGTELSYHNLSQSISNDVYQGLFWGIWFLANIPLILFSWFKIGKRFTRLTLLFASVATIVGLLLSIPIFINPDNKYNYFFLGNPLTMDNSLANYNVYVLSWNYYPVGSIIHTLSLSNPLNGSVSNMQQFLSLDPSQWAKIEELRTTSGYMDLTRVFSLLGYTAVLTLIYPLLISVIYISGGSTGGMDIPSIYWSDKKRKQLGNTLMILNTFTMFIGIILGSYVSAGIATPDHWGAEYFFSPNMILSLIYAIIGYLSVNFYFPKYKESNLKIYSNKSQEIINHMNYLHYPYQINVYKSIQVINNKDFETITIETIARYIELPKIIHEIKKVDADALLTINILHGIDGYLLMNKQRD